MQLLKVVLAFLMGKHYFETLENDLETILLSLATYWAWVRIPCLHCTLDIGILVCTSISGVLALLCLLSIDVIFPNGIQW